MSHIYKAEYFKRGKWKHFAKKIIFKMPPLNQQQGVSTCFPIYNVCGGFSDLIVPNIIGVKKITVEFDYDKLMSKEIYIRRRG